MLLEYKNLVLGVSGLDQESFFSSSNSLFLYVIAFLCFRCKVPLTIPVEPYLPRPRENS